MPFKFSEIDRFDRRYERNKVDHNQAFRIHQNGTYFFVNKPFYDNFVIVLNILGECGTATSYLPGLSDANKRIS